MTNSLHNEFSREYDNMSKKVRCIFRAKGRSEEYIRDNQDHAMCWAWTIFVRMSEKHPDWESLCRCRCAAKYAAMNVLTGRQFVKTREHGYIDALDHVSPQPFAEDRHQCARRFSGKARTEEGFDPALYDDETAMLAIVEALPKRLQGVARCLGRGMSKAAIARELDMGVSTVWLKRQQIGEWLLKGRLAKTGH